MQVDHLQKSLFNAHLPISDRLEGCNCAITQLILLPTELCERINKVGCV